jgi:hypothetical protein
MMGLPCLIMLDFVDGRARGGRKEKRRKGKREKRRDDRRENPNQSFLYLVILIGLVPERASKVT